MMVKTDLHTHTLFCDGNNSPEEMVLSAIERGFEAIGFSGHSYTAIDESYCMSLDGTRQYVEEIAALKEKYKGKIKIFCGIEQDYHSAPPREEFDYIIGSVHYVEFDGKYFAVDEDSETTQFIVNKYCGGDFDTLAERYFENVGEVLTKTNADIIGHFDLVSKFNEVLGIKTSERYLNAAKSAVKKLVAFDKPFEINVGAMTRGYRTSPYPSEDILKVIYRLGGKIIISGDCHNKDNLGDCFEDAYRMAKKCGFTEAFYLTQEGFKSYKL